MTQLNLSSLRYITNRLNTRLNHNILMAFHYWLLTVNINIYLVIYLLSPSLKDKIYCSTVYVCFISYAIKLYAIKNKTYICWVEVSKIEDILSF